MTVRERILAIKIMERQKKNPDYLKKLGVRVNMKKVGPASDERRKHRV